MSNLKKNFVLFFVLINTLIYGQFQDENKINEEQFYTEQKADSLNFLKQINYKYQNTWVYVDYKTGDDANCIGASGIYANKNNNTFKITNKDASKTDIWVNFKKIMGEKAYFHQRKCYVKYGDSFTVKNLEKGEYKLSILHGNQWKQPLNNYTCQGKFIENNNIESLGCSKVYTVTNNSHIEFTSTNEMIECDDKAMY